MSDVFILGGYGNFGKRIAAELVKRDVSVVLVGRNGQKASALAEKLGALATSLVFDVETGLDKALAEHKPQVVINTCGPFQAKDYRVAKCCIAHQVHYIDLADGREFVNKIATLNDEAVAAGVSILSGASTVPTLSSAVVEHFQSEFSQIDEMTFGISPGQKAERGLATTQGILSYVGKELAPFKGFKEKAFGWQDVYRQQYPELGGRWMANCEIPDLDLLPQKYDIKRIKFSAGLELSFMHLGLWGLSWFVRMGVPLKLERFASPLLSISNWFNGLGSADGGMHVLLSGFGADGETRLKKEWFIIAKDGDGPYIPTIPAILLAEKLVKDGALECGAYACVGNVSLKEYVQALSCFEVKTIER